MRIEDAGFGDGADVSEYVECSFDGSRIQAVAPGRARFVRCSFRDVKLKGWLCWDAEFVDCVFTGRGDELRFFGQPSDCVRDELGRDRNEWEMISEIWISATVRSDSGST